MDGERVFRGARIQRGYGLGSFFASMFRRAIPLFKSGGKYLVKKAAKTSINTLQDVMGGTDPKVALKRRLADTSDEMLNDMKRKIRRKMTGAGRVVKRRGGGGGGGRGKKRRKKQIKKRRRKNKDIFA